MRIRIGYTLVTALVSFAFASGCATTMDGGDTGGAGLTAWIVDGGRDLRGDSLPSPENEIYAASRGGVRLSAAQNETIGLQLGLRTGSPPSGPYNVTLTDLTGSAGRIDSAASVRFFRVLDVRVERFRSWYPEHTDRQVAPIDVPDILVPWNAPRGSGPLRLDDGRSRAVWIDIHIPADTTPGEYVGTLRVGDAAAPAFAAEIRVQVLSISLPPEPALAVVASVDPRDLLAAHLNWPSDIAEETRILPDVAGHQAAQLLVHNTMELLHQHRLTPALRTSFPKYKVAGEREVEMEWAPYDALVAGWIDGNAFADGTRLPVWPLPVSLAYPDAVRNGGFGSPRYARLLTAYLAECQRRFDDRGWSERALLAMSPPGLLTVDAVERARRTSGILKQNNVSFPILTHLPAGSLRALGWHDAPPTALPDVAVWCPPAGWWEPDAMTAERGLGKRTWFVPDVPPYSASLAVEAPAADARALAWQAFRYDADGVWLDGVADLPRRGRNNAGDSLLYATPLIYSGADYGIVDSPIPSIRLKRLRRGLHDVALLKQLSTQGKSLLAQSTARQLVAWAFTDAASSNLITTHGAGWDDDAYAYSLARNLLIAELADDAAADAGQTRADWGRLLTQSSRARVEVRGARLELTGDRLFTRLFTSISNAGGMSISGSWSLPRPPAGWKITGSENLNVPPGGHGMATVELAMETLAYSAVGVFEFPIQFDSAASGAFETGVRLVAAACPVVERAPKIDGDLSDWLVAPNNVGSEFRLVRGSGASGDHSRRPVLPSRATFCMDGKTLYIAVQCGLNRGERPLWRSDNEIPIDGAIPWGQDVVEVLISPRDPLEAGLSDLHVLQIKPNALVVARRGPRTDPPIAASEPWPANAQAAVSVRGDAWNVELAIPLAAFDADALRRRVWGLNVTRLDARRGEYSSWSGARGHCYAPETLGNLVLQQP